MKSICSGLLSQAFPQNLAKRNRAIAKCGSYTFPNSQEIPRPDQWPTHLPLFYRFYRVGVGREMGEEKKGIKKIGVSPHVTRSTCDVRKGGPLRSQLR